MRRAILAALLAGSMVGCASIEFKMTMFQKQARRADVDELLVAERLLCAGRTPEDIESILRDGGTASEDAHRIVALAQANGRCETKPKGGQ